MHFKFSQSQQMSCFHCIVTFIIAIQSWTWTARSGYTGLMTAAASVKSPGEMEPKSLSLRVGGNADITCRLSEPQSSEIWFIEEKTKQKFPINSSNIEIIDEYTAVLKIRNATEQKSRYQCKIKEYAIGETEFYVGSEPKNVTDFSCMSYDYEYMECNFTSPNKYILTQYELEYTFARDMNIYKCTCNKIANGKWTCNVNGYMPMRDEYLFILRAINIIGSNVQKFKINNNKIVKPSAVVIKKDLNAITSNSFKLSWEKKRYSYYKFGLEFHIQIRYNNSDWRDVAVPEFISTKDIYTIVISDLYAYWTYWVKVKVKSKAVDDDNFWSDESIESYKTKPQEPKRAPQAPLGSFYIDSSETHLQLYWEEMPNFEHSGPGFHYIVNEKNEKGHVVRSLKTNESSFTYPWKNVSMREFAIKSANEIGESIDESIIRVYRSRKLDYEHVKRIAKYYHNSRYTLTWTAPENFDELLNYTVFWCSPKIELPNQCKGPISFMYVNKSEKSFTTNEEDRSLNLAISANYRDYNKGMQWASCSAEVSSELVKMDIEVNALNESAILVKWNTGTICSSILKGYNLTYCLGPGRSRCNTVELSMEKKDYRNYIITNLPPYTNVCVYMFMYSPTKNGLTNDAKCVRTKAAAPSPPTNLNCKKITSKSAVISWSPPDIKNGILSHYTIYWQKYPESTYEKNTTSISTTRYHLTDLSSYSNYEVYITAHTIKESAPSKSINFTTLIGIPSEPRNIKINDNETVIQWDRPYLPSGRHLFYVVALTHRDEKQNEVFEKVSIVKGRSCRFKAVECLNSTLSYFLKVRAVNVGNKDEVDTEIVDVNKNEILNGAQIDEDFCKSLGDKENFIDNNTEFFFKNDIGMFYFASPWITASHSYGCAETSSTPLYAVAFIVLIVFAAYPCCWLRNKIYNMKNIKVILPEGLATQVSNYKYANNTMGNSSDLGTTTKQQFHSDISRSNDCLVSYGQKENLNLINNFHNGSSNALSSLSSNSSTKDRHKDDEEQIGEHPSLETTNEELSSNSSSASNSNFTYHDHRQIKRLSSIDSNNTIPASVCDEDEVDDDLNENNDNDDSSKQKPNDESFQQQFNPQQNNGYVTHNSQLLASILNTAEKNVPSRPQLNSTFPKMTNDGYIQPSAAKQLFLPSFSLQQQQPPTSINGYTSLETLGKLTTPDDSRHINIPTSQIIATTVTNSIPLNVANNTPTTSPIITDLHESPSTEFQKDSIQPNGTTTFSTTDRTQPNNNNTIYGYVTQQQLANFGTNVALGKELNT